MPFIKGRRIENGGRPGPSAWKRPNIEEKKPPGKWEKFYFSGFHTAKMVVIICDAIVLGCEAECLSRYTFCPAYAETGFVIFDYAVSIFLILGLVLQLYVVGRSILSDFLLMFEVLVVIVFSVFGTFLWRMMLTAQPELYEYEGLSHFLRMGRICRVVLLVRAAEILRALPFLNDLYLLIRGLRDSLQTLVSSIFILGIVVFSSAVILTAYVGQHDAEGWSYRSKEYRISSFSSIWYSMETLFRFVFVDDAADIIEPLSRDVPALWYMFMGFILVSIFLVMNLIMAVIVNQAMVFTKSDKEHRAKQLQKEKEHYTKKVIKFFNKIDLDGNAKLSFKEFEKAFQHPEIRNDLLAVGVEVNELRELFFILDTSNTGELAVADFVTGMQRIRGQATSRDLLMISQYTRRVFKLLMSIKTKVGGKNDREDESVHESAVRKKLQTLESDIDSTRALVKELARMLSDGYKTKKKRDASDRDSRSTARVSKSKQTRSPPRATKIKRPTESDSNPKRRKTLNGEKKKEKEKQHRSISRRKK